VQKLIKKVPSKHTSQSNLYINALKGTREKERTDALFFTGTLSEIPADPEPGYMTPSAGLDFYNAALEQLNDVEKSPEKKRREGMKVQKT